MSDRFLKLNIGTLRQAIELSLDELERVHGAELHFDKDYFWAISSLDRMNVYEPPSDHTIGQISDIIGEIEKLVEDPERVTVLDAAKIAELLRTIGEALPS